MLKHLIPESKTVQIEVFAIYPKTTQNLDSSIFRKIRVIKGNYFYQKFDFLVYQILSIKRTNENVKYDSPEPIVVIFNG